MTVLPRLDGHEDAVACYPEGLWALALDREDGRHVILGGHAGGFAGGFKGEHQNWNPMPSGPGFEAPFARDFGPASVEDRFPLTNLVGRFDTHEHGFGCAPILLPSGAWIFFACRTTWTSWMTQDRIKVGNRARVSVFRAFDPLTVPYECVGLDAIGPADRTCRLRNTDRGQPPGGLSTGPHMVSAVGLEDGRLFALIRDEVGFMRRTSSQQVAYYISLSSGDHVNVVQAGSPSFVGLNLLTTGMVPMPTDMARDETGTYHILLSSCLDPTPAWWDTCTRIDEWLSADGLHWERGSRSWALDAGGPTWDGGYVRGPRGEIDSSALCVVALTSDGRPWYEGGRRVHWWADDGVELPPTWGQEPGAQA